MELVSSRLDDPWWWRCRRPGGVVVLEKLGRRLGEMVARLSSWAFVLVFPSWQWRCPVSTKKGGRAPHTINQQQHKQGRRRRCKIIQFNIITTLERTSLSYSLLLSRCCCVCYSSLVDGGRLRFFVIVCLLLL